MARLEWQDAQRSLLGMGGAGLALQSAKGDKETSNTYKLGQVLHLHRVPIMGDSPQLSQDTPGWNSRPDAGERLRRGLAGFFFEV